MNNETLIDMVARALATARQPYHMSDGSHEPRPEEFIEAGRLVGVIQYHALIGRIDAQALKDFLWSGNEQAVKLFQGTGNTMWVGKSMAYNDVLEAVEYGALGEGTQE